MLHFARGWSRGSTLFTASERTSDLLPVDIVHDVKITTTTAISNAESLSSSLFPLVLTGMVWGYCNEEPFSVSPSNWVKKRRWIWSWDVCGLEFSQQSNLILAQNQFMPDSVWQGAEGPTASSRRTAGWNVCGKERRNQLVWKEEAGMKQWFSQSAQLQLNSAATSPSLRNRIKRQVEKIQICQLLKIQIEIERNCHLLTMWHLGTVKQDSDSFV